MDHFLIRIATEEDLDTLANLNKQLIEDEKHDNPMNVQQLKERMKGFIAGDNHAYLFLLDEQFVGYALVNKNRNPYYLRQFFICRDFRRRGLGKRAFHALLNLLNINTIDLEVLVWNNIGRSFWKSLGFQERSIYMRYTDQ